MKLREFLPWIGCLILAFFLYQARCSATSENEPTTVVTKEKTGSFQEVKNPVSETAKVRPENIVPKQLIKWNDSIIEVENPINIDMVNNYLTAKDSIQKLQLYIKSLTENQYEIVQEDSLLKTTNKIKTQGTLLSFKQDYLIKSSSIKVNHKQTVLRIIGGMELGNNTKLDNFSAKANLMLQNRKGDVFSGSFDSHQTIWVGWNKTIFNIRR